MRTALEIKEEKQSICSETCCQVFSNIPSIINNQNSVLNLFVYVILHSAIARGMDWVGVRADALVPLMAVMADLRRLKDFWQHSHCMVVEYM